MGPIENLIIRVSMIYATGGTTEHTHHSKFETVFCEHDRVILTLNEPKRIKCGAPDFIIRNEEIVVGQQEAKDPPSPVRNMEV